MFSIGTMTPSELKDFLVDLGFKYENRRGITGDFRFDANGVTILECYDTAISSRGTTDYTFTFTHQHRAIISISVMNEIFDQDLHDWVIPPYMTSKRIPNLLVELHRTMHSPWEFRELILKNLELLKEGVSCTKILDSDFWFRLNYQYSKLNVGDHPWPHSEVKILDINHTEALCKLTDGRWYSLGVLHDATLPEGTKTLDDRFRTSEIKPRILKGIINNSNIERILEKNRLNCLHKYPLVFDTGKMVRSSQVVI